MEARPTRGRKRCYLRLNALVVGHEHYLPDCLMEYMLLPIFVESRDLFFEKLGVVRTRAD